MKITLITDAMQALDEARHALVSGALSIPEQIALGSRCCQAETALRFALEKECPDIKITVKEGA